MSRPRLPRTFHAEPILHLLIIKIVYDHGENITNLAFGRERYFGKWFRSPFTEKNKSTRRGMSRKNREIHSARHMACPIGKRMTIAHFKLSELVGVVQSETHMYFRSNTPTPDAGELLFLSQIYPLTEEQR